MTDGIGTRPRRTGSGDAATPRATAPRKRRRRPLSARVRCTRDGCPRRRQDGYDFCSLICRAVSDQLTDTEELCRLVGPGKRSSELWTSAAEFNDSLTKLLRETRRAEGIIHNRNGTTEVVHAAGYRTADLVVP